MRGIQERFLPAVEKTTNPNSAPLRLAGRTCRIPMSSTCQSFANAELTYGVATHALALQRGDDIAHFLGAAEVADQDGIGGIDDDGIVDAQQHNEPIGGVNQA